MSWYLNTYVYIYGEKVRKSNYEGLPIVIKMRDGTQACKASKALSLEEELRNLEDLRRLYWSIN